MVENRDLNEAVRNWKSPPLPPQGPIEGKLVRLEPLCAARQSGDLFLANRAGEDDGNWDWLPYGPFSRESDYANWLSDMENLPDPRFFAVFDKMRGQFTGVASYLRIAPKDGSIEVGHINFSPLLQRTVASTEVMFLMMKWAFEAGYRRYEWKCNALNLPSRRAAQRLGFSFEGIFRQATISKGRNRDTAWFAMIDKEWPQLKQAFERWLSEENFDAEGRQKQRLADLTAAVLVNLDPALAQ